MRHDRHEFYRHYAYNVPEFQRQGVDVTGITDDGSAPVSTEVRDSGLGRYTGDSPTGVRQYDALGTYVSGLGQDPVITTTVTDASSGVTTYFPTDTSSGAVAPAAAAAAVSTPAATGGGWFADVLSAITGTAQAVAQTAATVAPVVLSIDQQSRFASINATRAAQGLPPLTASQYSQQYVPTPTFGVAVAPATMQSVMWIAGGLGLVALAAVALGRK
jgi:hypothetical protein